MAIDWTAPGTWTYQEFVLASKLNTHLRDNSAWLKNRPFANTVMTTIATTTSTSFVELTESRATFTSYGGNVIIAVCGIFSNNTSGTTNTFDFAIDGTKQGDATVGLTQIYTPGTDYADCLSIVFFSTSAPSAGSHTYSMYWKVSSGTGSTQLRLFALELR